MHSASGRTCLPLFYMLPYVIGANAHVAGREVFSANSDDSISRDSD